MFVSFCLTTAARTGLMATGVGRQALTDQWVRRAEAFGQNVTDDLYAQFERLGSHGLEAATLTSVASGPILALVLAAGMPVVFRRHGVRAGSDPAPTPYLQALAVVVHANVILVVRDVVAAPVNYLRESIASPLTLGTLVPMLDESSLAARFLSMIDLFFVWWLIVLAIGTSVLYRRAARPVALTYLALYVAVATVMAAAMAMFTWMSGGSM